MTSVGEWDSWPSSNCPDGERERESERNKSRMRYSKGIQGQMGHPCAQTHSPEHLRPLQTSHESTNLGERERGVFEVVLHLFYLSKLTLRGRMSGTARGNVMCFVRALVSVSVCFLPIHSRHQVR